ncbi:MAG: carboxymuconolactone decarboxylase family protein [Planctomycetota bacterium]
MIEYSKDNLKQLKTIGENAPAAMQGFQALSKAAFDEGALPKKVKELIAVAVAISKECPYCMDIHAASARKAGATDEELAEASMVAAAIGAGAAVTHATHAFA